MNAPPVLESVDPLTVPHVFGVLHAEDVAWFEADGHRCVYLNPDEPDLDPEIAAAVTNAHLTIIPAAWTETELALAASIKALRQTLPIAMSVAVNDGKDVDYQSPTEAIETARPAHVWIEMHSTPERAVDPVASSGADVPHLTLIDPSTFEGQPIPPRLWHVPGLIPHGTVTKLSGAGGEGKTLLALQLAVSTVTGQPWIGKDVAKGRALYIGAEDDRDELQRRLADVVREYGVSFADLKDLRIAALAGLDAILAAPSGRGGIIAGTKLWQELEAAVGRFRPRLIVLDPLADLFAGDEINRSQARQFIALLRGLAIRYDATLLLLSHPSLTGIANGRGSSGSTGWDNSVRSALYMTPAEAPDGTPIDPDVRLLKTTKSNYARTGDQIAIRWRQGIFVPDGEASSPTWLDRKTGDARADGIFLALVKAYADEGRHVSASPSSTFAPSVFAKDARAKGLQRNVLAAAMNRLFSAAKIATKTIGPAYRQRLIIVLSDDGKDEG